MNAREKKLGIAFGCVVGLVLVMYVVWPAIKPAFDLRGQLAKAVAARDEAADKHDALDNKLTKKYAEYVRRSGGTDADEIYQTINAKLSQLVQDAGIGQKGANFHANDPTTDKKTLVTSITFSVTGNGKMGQCREFIRSVYRLPYLIRFNSLKLTPGQAAQRAYDDNVKLDAEIEVIVPAAEKDLAAVRPPYLDSLDSRVLLKDGRIETWQPFVPFADTQVATGPQETPPPTPPPPTPPPAGPPTDPNNAAQFLRGSIGYGVEEVVIEDRSKQKTEYVAVGETLDAGKLVLVHALGAVVHKLTPDKDFGYFVYPLGDSLVNAIKLEEAQNWPEIQVAMMQYFDRKEHLHERDGEMGPPDVNEAAPSPAPEHDEAAMPDGTVPSAANAMTDEIVGPPDPHMEAAHRPASLIGTTGEASSPHRPPLPDTRAGSSADSQPDSGGRVQKDAPANRPRRGVKPRPARTPQPAPAEGAAGTVAPGSSEGGAVEPAEKDRIPPE